MTIKTPHPTDSLAVAEETLGNLRAQVESKYLRALPPLSGEVPPDLVAAFEDYQKTRDAWHDADAEAMGAETAVYNARRSESAEVAAIVRDGGDPLTVDDRIIEAERNLRRATTVATVKANDLKTATSVLVLTADAHRTSQRKAAQPAVDRAGAVLQDALVQLQRARTSLDVAAGTAAWWDTVNSHHFPHHGQATREAIVEAMGRWSVADSRAAITNEMGMR